MKKRNRDREEWFGARERHHLSDVRVQIMTRELGMNPQKLGKLDKYKQEPWKMPLGPYIEHLYRTRFGSASPDTLRPLRSARAREEKREARRRSRQQLLRETP